MGYTNTMRLVGLNSGLDTESLVTQLMNAESLRLNKYKRQATTLTWKQEAYRSIYSDLKSFKSSHLDVSSSITMRLSSTFNKFTTTVKNASGAASSAVKATSSSSSTMGTYKVQVQQLAQTDVWQSESKVSGIRGNSGFDYTNVMAGDKYNVTLDGKSRDISFSGGEEVTFKYSIPSGDPDIQPTTRTGTATIGFDVDGKMTFELKGEGVDDLTAGFTLINEGGNDTYYNDLTALSADKGQLNQFFVTAFNTKLEDKFGTETVKVKVGDNFEDRTEAKIFASLGADNKLVINTSPLSTHTASIQDGADRKDKDGKSIEGSSSVGALGITSGASTAMRTSDTLNKLFGIDNGTKDNKIIKINNGKLITFNGNTTLDEFMKMVNESDSGVTLSYNSSAQTFKLESNETGATNKISMSGTGISFLKNSLKLAESQEAQDSLVTIDGETFIRETNDYKELDVNWSFTEATGSETLTVNIGRDTDTTFNAIKSFVDGYNALIDTLNSYTDAKRPKSNGSYFDPLLDEEKADMTESEIAKWEEQAKTGLLYRDNIITNITNQMRTALYQAVEMDDGSKLGLYQIGITTGDWNEKGKLVIEEDKLRAAIEEHGDKVSDLFTKSGTGLGDKLDKIVKDASDPYGTIAQKAGIEGSYTESNNEMYRQIKSQNEKISNLLAKLARKETYYYNMFAKLEAAMSQSDSQMSYISSVFGS